MHLWITVAQSRYLLAFAMTALVSTGGFMLMPFSSAYIAGNLGIGLDHLPTIYLITGLCTIVMGPLIGKASDSFGPLRVFMFGTALSILMVLIFTHLGRVSLSVIVVVRADHTLAHFEVVGYVVVGASLVAAGPLWVGRGFGGGSARSHRSAPPKAVDRECA